MLPRCCYMRIKHKRRNTSTLSTWQSANINIFTIQVGNDQKRNLRAAAVFEAFIERLDEINQLDALKDLVNVCRSFREWSKVEYDYLNYIDASSGTTHEDRVT